MANRSWFVRIERYDSTNVGHDLRDHVRCVKRSNIFARTWCHSQVLRPTASSRPSSARDETRSPCFSSPVAACWESRMSSDFSKMNWPCKVVLQLIEHCFQDHNGFSTNHDAWNELLLGCRRRARLSAGLRLRIRRCLIRDPVLPGPRETA